MGMKGSISKISDERRKRPARERATDRKGLMSVARDDILLQNVYESLALYQRSLVWATTAALSGCLLVFKLRDSNPAPVEVLYASITAPTAWLVAQAVYLIFGFLAGAAIRQYRAALEALDPPDDVREAIGMYPSLATLPGGFFCYGSALLAPIATVVSWILEVRREGGIHEQPFLAVPILAALLLGPYIDILTMLYGTRKRKGRKVPAK